MERSVDRDSADGGAMDQIMQLLEMNGSYPLTDAAVEETVTRTSPGNYALGYMDGSTFTVFYIGRSDSDVRTRLHEWVDAPSRDRCGDPRNRRCSRLQGPTGDRGTARRHILHRGASRADRRGFRVAGRAGDLSLACR